MKSVMERLWIALENISHDFDYPADPESLMHLENALTKAGLMVVEIDHTSTAGMLSQMG